MTFILEKAHYMRLGTLNAVSSPKRIFKPQIQDRIALRIEKNTVRGLNMRRVIGSKPFSRQNSLKFWKHSVTVKTASSVGLRPITPCAVASNWLMIRRTFTLPPGLGSL